MPSFLDEAVIQSYHLPSRKQSEAVIYYRKPNRGPEANWIVTADSQLNKQATYLMRGWHPLPQYGLVGRAACLYDSAYRWYPILANPAGAAEFPVEQILQLGWHRPDGLPPFPPGKDHERQAVYFPQLAEAFPEGFTDYDCPQCESRQFVKAVHMADHLMKAHGWDYHTVMELGDRLGIDFSKDFAPKARRTYHFPTEAPERVSTTRQGVTVTKAVIPSREELEEAARQRAAVAVADEPSRVKVKRTQTPAQAAKSRAALEKARLVREAKKAERLAAETAAQVEQMVQAEEN